jgi:hypothetical protein
LIQIKIYDRWVAVSTRSRDARARSQNASGASI